MFRCLLGLGLLLMTLNAAAASETRRFYGYAFDLASDRYLYTEVHEQVIENGRWVRGSIRYYDPDNRLIGEKSLDFSSNPTIPVYTLRLPGQGYEEGIRSVSSDLINVYKISEGRTREKALVNSPPMAADSGFHNLVVAEFERLLRGETVRFTFGVAGNLDSFRFRARKEADVSFEGRPAVRFKVEADSLLRLVAPDLTIVYDPASRQLLDYRGVSNIHDPATGKAYNARIVYPDRPPAGAPATLPPLQP